MDFREAVLRKFETGYWEKVAAELGHNFFDTHWGRTVEYSNRFFKELIGKKVLEVGAYPGVETAALLHTDIAVTALDSPKYTPDYYRAFLEKHCVPQIVWDIVQGAPPVEDRWDYALMSDVLLHIEGFPYDFMDWLFAHCDTVILLNYPSDGKTAEPAKYHTLEKGFPYLGEDTVIKRYMEKGAELVASEMCAGRKLVIMRGIK